MACHDFEKRRRVAGAHDREQLGLLRFERRAPLGDSLELGIGVAQLALQCVMLVLGVGGPAQLGRQLPDCELRRLLLQFRREGSAELTHLRLDALDRGDHGVDAALSRRQTIELYPSGQQVLDQCPGQFDVEAVGEIELAKQFAALEGVGRATILDRSNFLLAALEPRLQFSRSRASDSPRLRCSLAREMASRAEASSTPTSSDSGSRAAESSTAVTPQADRRRASNAAHLASNRPTAATWFSRWAKLSQVAS